MLLRSDPLLEPGSARGARPIRPTPVPAEPAVFSRTARIQVELLMRDDLAERVLAHVMSWDPAQIAKFGACLQDLARYKF
jgi:hypothetical protein